MTPEETQSFNQAISFAQSGWKEEAHFILKQLARANPKEPNLFLWLAFTSNNLAEARAMLKRAEVLNPANPALAGAKKWLASQEVSELVGSSPVNSMLPGWLAASLESNSAYVPGVQLHNEASAQINTLELKTTSYANLQIPVTVKPSAPKRKTNLPAIIIIAVLVQLLVIGGVVIFLLSNKLQGDQIAAYGLPVYSEVVRLEITSAERKAWLNAAGPAYQNLKASALEYYKIKKNDALKVLTFYDASLKSQGWEPAPYSPSIITQNSLDRTNTYSKGTQKVYLMVSSQNKSDQIPGLNSKVAADEVLMVVFAATF